MKKINYLVCLIAASLMLACSSGKKNAEEEAASEAEEATTETTMSESETESTETEASASESEDMSSAAEEESYTDDLGRLVYVTPDVNPEFPGGEKELRKYLRQNLEYPKSAKDAGNEGRVLVQFVVNESGEVGNVEVIEPVADASLNEEAKRVVSNMPAWTPASKGGSAVNARFTLPVNFKIQ